MKVVTQMMRLLSLLFLLCLTRACCPLAKHIEPTYPRDTLGWEQPDKETGKVQGRFVLRKGEEISNGEISIKLIDVAPGNVCDAGTQEGGARAILRFSRAVDQNMICEDEFPDHGVLHVTATHCGDKLKNFGIGYVNINAISLRDGWIYIVL